MDYNKAALKMHEENKGKIGVVSKVQVKTRDDLSTAYTPGVAEPCRKIRDDKKEVYRYTAKGNLVAVVSDGTAVDKQRLQDLLKTLGLENRKTHLPNQLSGGQQQRTSIGRAMITNPARTIYQLLVYT